MKRILWLLALMPALAFGQAAGPYGIFGGPIPSASLPPATSTAGAANTYAFTSDLGLLQSNGSAWISGGGATSFGQLNGGTSPSAQTYALGTSSDLNAGSGTIEASTAVSLASAPSACAGGQFVTKIDVFGNPTCGTPAGSGNVSTSGIITTGALPVWASGTTLSGTVTFASNTLAGNSGGGLASLSASQAIGVLNSQTANAQTGTSYTFVLGDANNEVTTNNAASNTVCVPPNSSVNYAVGTLLTVQELGAGVTTIAPAGASGCAGSGVTIQSPQQGSSTSLTYSLGGAYGFMQLQQTQTNTWNVIGWAQPLQPIAFGGTGIGTAPTDGQLLIGNSSTSKYAVATLTAGSGITVTNGHGTITVASTASGGPQDEMGFMIPSVSQATTDYACPTAGTGLQVASTVPCIVANASGGTFKNLFIQTTNAPASTQTFTVTLYTGTAGSSLTSTTLTCQIANPNKSCSDVTHTVSVTQGQGWMIQIVTSATSGATGISGFGLEFDP